MATSDATHVSTSHPVGRHVKSFGRAMLVDINPRIATIVIAKEAHGAVSDRSPPQTLASATSHPMPRCLRVGATNLLMQISHPLRDFFSAFPEPPGSSRLTSLASGLSIGGAFPIRSRSQQGDRRPGGGCLFYALINKIFAEFSDVPDA
jgi:hypothetical protein